MSDRLDLPEGVPPIVQYCYYLTAGCNPARRHCWLSLDTPEPNKDQE